jgi:cobalt-zinc-cadmium efflux system membrane fusion protein
MSKRAILLNTFLAVVVLGFAAAGGLHVYRQWPTRGGDEPPAADHGPVAAAAGVPPPVRISPQARKNLGLIVEPLKLGAYHLKIDVPGVIEDRPGVSDRGVVAPVAGMVLRMHAFPGDKVEPGGPLFTLRLVSETLHASQLELFKATKEIEIARRQKARLADLAHSGAVAQSRIIEIDNQIERTAVHVQAYRQGLAARGLSTEQIEAAAGGDFLTEIVVVAPPSQPLAAQGIENDASGQGPDEAPFDFEVHRLGVELGQHVDAGQVLCRLADHRILLIEGRGFRDDIPLVQRAARFGLPVAVEFEPGDEAAWPPAPAELPIHHVGNVVDPGSRTFAFYLVLANQWQTYAHEGRTRLLWRFRPGDRVRLSITVDVIENVFVLPREAVVREGPEAYVFRQNGALFDRLPVHVLHEDRSHVVIASDGSLRAGWYVARNGGASIQRIQKAQSAAGLPAGVHVHADGTVHGAH